ncbi:MAG TPA: hypothetical protein VIX85_09520 [Acidimicrobiales bacterium]
MATGYRPSRYGMTVEQAAESQLQMEQRAVEDGLEFHLGGLASGTRGTPTALCTGQGVRPAG